MAAGLQIFNDFGNVQVDESYHNLFLKHKFTGNVASGDNEFVSNDGYIGIEVTGAIFPVAALYCGAAASGGYIENDAGTWRWFWRNLPEGQPYEVFIFDLVPPPPDNFGLHVFDASGQMTFHSSLKPMRVLDFIVRPGGGQNPSGQFTYGGGRKVAVVTAVEPFWSSGHPTTKAIHEGFAIEWAGGATDNYGTMGAWIPLDVSGY